MYNMRAPSNWHCGDFVGQEEKQSTYTLKAQLLVVSSCDTPQASASNYFITNHTMSGESRAGEGL
jgi:hypothetical protein